MNREPNTRKHQTASHHLPGRSIAINVTKIKVKEKQTKTLSSYLSRLNNGRRKNG